MKLKKDKKGRVVIPREFDRIQKHDLIPGDILLFYHGNKLTEWHGRNRKKKYGRSTLPPFHAAVVYRNDNDDCFILDPEITTGFSLLEEYYRRTSYRIDVVRVNASGKQVEKAMREIRNLGVKEGFYDWKGFLAQGSQVPFLEWMKIIKPAKGKFFCSDAVAYVWDKAGVRVSPRKNNYTSPVDLQIYGMQHHNVLTLKGRYEVFENPVGV